MAAVVSAAVGKLPFSMLATVLEAAVGTMVSSVYEFIDTKGLGIRTWFESQLKFKDKDVYGPLMMTGERL